MCEWGTSTPIFVIRRNNFTAKDGWHLVYVDSCIADYVQHMNGLGIITKNCCCGHGKSPPTVLIALESEQLLQQYGYKYEPYYIDNVLESWLHYILLSENT